jgi:hypothetical protein
MKDDLMGALEDLTPVQLDRLGSLYLTCAESLSNPYLRTWNLSVSALVLSVLSQRQGAVDPAIERRTPSQCRAAAREGPRQSPGRGGHDGGGRGRSDNPRLPWCINGCVEYGTSSSVV